MPGVVLNLLLLAADAVRAFDVPADAVFIGRQVPDLLLRVIGRALRFGDLPFLVGDTLQLVARRGVQVPVANVDQQCVRRQIRDGICLVVKAFFRDGDLPRGARSELDFKTVRGGGLLGGLLVQQRVSEPHRGAR